MKEFFTGLLRDLTTTLPGILFLVGVGAALLVYILYRIGKALPDPTGSAAKHASSEDESHHHPAPAPAATAPAAAAGHDAHGHGDGHDDHGHGHSHPLKVLGDGLAAIAVAGFLFLILAYLSVEFYNRFIRTDSAKASASSVSTDVVATKAPTGSWLTIKGVPGYHIIVCRASDPTCAERSPIGFRMRCVNLEGDEVDWTPEACEGLLSLKIQSTGKKSLPIIWHYRPE